MPRRQKSRSVLDEMFARVGPREAMKVATFVSAWKIANDRRPHPDQPFHKEDFSSFWQQSTAKTYRDLHAFRKCFPEYATPDELIARMEKQGISPGLTGFNRARWTPVRQPGLATS